MAIKSPAIFINLPVVASAFSNYFDVSLFNSFSIFCKTGGVGTWAVYGYYDETIDSGILAQIVSTANPASGFLVTVSPAAGATPSQAVYRSIRVQCAAFTSGAPVYYLLGQY